MVGTAIGHHGHVDRPRPGAQVPQLEATQFQNDCIGGSHRAEIFQQAGADISAQPGAAAGGLEDGGRHGGGGRFAVGTGDAHDLRRAGVEEQLDLRGRRNTGGDGDLQEAVVRPDRRVDHDQVGLAEVVLPVAAQVVGNDRRVGQPVERLAESRCGGRVGDGDPSPPGGQPSRGRHAAPEVAQSHQRDSSSVDLHRIQLNGSEGGRQG